MSVYYYYVVLASVIIVCGPDTDFRLLCELFFFYFISFHHQHYNLRIISRTDLIVRCKCFKIYTHFYRAAKRALL